MLGFILEHINTLISFVFYYILVWMVVFFMVLPFGQRIPDHVEPGQVKSAPEPLSMKRKCLYTSLISFVFLLTIYVLEAKGIISFAFIQKGR